MISMKRFAGVVAQQLLYKAFNVGGKQGAVDELVDPDTRRSGKRSMDEMDGSRDGSNGSSLGKAKEDDAVTVEIEAHPPSSMSSLSLCEERDRNER